VQLDKLISSAWARRNSALQQLEFYRKDLGQSWRQFSDEIIDAATAEAEELEKRMAAPLLVPFADQTPNAVASDSREPAEVSVIPSKGAGPADTTELSDQERT
jgi:hypothetical protein